MFKMAAAFFHRATCNGEWPFRRSTGCRHAQKVASDIAQLWLWDASENLLREPQNALPLPLLPRDFIFKMTLIPRHSRGILPLPLPCNTLV